MATSFARALLALGLALLAPAVVAQEREIDGMVRAHLERIHGQEWSRFDLLDVRFTNGAPADGARLGSIEGDSDPSPSGSILLTVEAVEAHGIERLPVSAVVRAWVEAPVASRSLARGSILGEGDLVIEERPLSELRGATPISAERGARLRARRDLRAGDLLTTAAIDEAPAIASGSRVQIRLRSGRLVLTTAGIARRSGRVGDQIPVENADTRKTLVARVVDDRTVEVLP